MDGNDVVALQRLHAAHESIMAAVEESSRLQLACRQVFSRVAKCTEHDTVELAKMMGESQNQLKRAAALVQDLDKLFQGKVSEDALRILDKRIPFWKQTIAQAAKGHTQCALKAKEVAKEGLRSRIHTLQPSWTEEQVEQATLQSQTVVADALLRDRCDEVETQRRTVAELVASISELRDMFSDFASLVAGQHDLVVCIEHQVDTAEVRVQQGTRELRQAVAKAKAARRKQCCCVLIAVVLLLVIIFVPLGVHLSS